MVTITECRSHPRIWRGRTLDSVIRRVWGTDAFFERDNGLRPGWYGQIFRYLKSGGATSETGRVRVDGEAEREASHG